MPARRDDAREAEEGRRVSKHQKLEEDNLQEALRLRQRGVQLARAKAAGPKKESRNQRNNRREY